MASKLLSSDFKGSSGSSKKRGSIINSPIFSQAENGTDIGSFRTTCESLIDVNQKNEAGQTLLYLAARNGHAEFVAALLNVKGIDINCCVDESGGSALHGLLIFPFLSFSENY